MTNGAVSLEHLICIQLIKIFPALIGIKIHVIGLCHHPDSIHFISAKFVSLKPILILSSSSIINLSSGLFTQGFPFPEIIIIIIIIIIIQFFIYLRAHSTARWSNSIKQNLTCCNIATMLRHYAERENICTFKLNTVISLLSKK
jgi:hypothetical protein